MSNEDSLPTTFLNNDVIGEACDDLCIRKGEKRTLIEYMCGGLCVFTDKNVASNI